MTREQAAAYRQRWALVNQAEREELRATSMDEKFRQLAALMASVDDFGWREALEEEEEQGREIWRRLREVWRE